MAQTLPPPPERFDPVTARWLTPGGPLHDPLRDSADPDHTEPVELLDPVPRELAQPGMDVSTTTPTRTLRLAFFAAVVIIIAGMLIAGIW